MAKTEEMKKMMETRYEELSKVVEEKETDLAGLKAELSAVKAYLQAIGVLEKPAMPTKRGRKPKNQEEVKLPL